MLDLSHKKLDIWNFSLDLVSKIYGLTSSFPKEELFGLTNQLRRACTSIPTNIAEGCGRDSSKDFAFYFSTGFYGHRSITECVVLFNHAADCTTPSRAF